MDGSALHNAVNQQVQVRILVGAARGALFIAQIDGDTTRKNRVRLGCRVCGGFGPGHALSYHCGQQLWKRIKRRARIRGRGFGAHLVRHYAQNMARQGASIADIQDVLGHSSDKMARHYAGEARGIQAAEIMARYSLAH